MRLSRDGTLVHPSGRHERIWAATVSGTGGEEVVCGMGDTRGQALEVAFWAATGENAPPLAADEGDGDG